MLLYRTLHQHTMITTDEIRQHTTLDDGVEITTLRIENNDIIMTLTGGGASQSFRIRRTTDRGTTLQIIQCTCQLVTFIMHDPLLHRGVKNINCFASDGAIHKADILFYNHKIDMLGFFRDGDFDTRKALLAILRACEESSPTAVCAISFEEVPAGENVAILDGESQFMYNEKHIRRWIQERGTSPFTRAVMTEDAIKIVQRVYSPVPVAQQPNLRPPKRQKVTRERIVGVVDRSGSMINCLGTVQALEDFILGKKEESKTSTSVTLHAFNHEVEQVFHTDDIQTFTPFTDTQKDMLKPTGMTALYDAICSAGQELLNALNAGENALLCVLTDGEDTSSSSTHEDARAMLETLKQKGVQCIFLAANIGDARVRGVNLGFTPETSLTFEPETVDTAWACLREATGGNTPVVFSQIQRQLSAPTQFTQNDTTITCNRMTTQ